VSALRLFALCVLASLVAAGCGTSSCGLWDKARIDISFDASTQNANRVVIEATLDNQMMRTFDVNKRAGSDHDALDIEFADKQIPSYGATLALTVTAVKADGVVLGVGHASQHISPGCETVDVTVPALTAACSSTDDPLCGAGTCTNSRCCLPVCP
jgi:hypothetical protein